MRPCRGRTIILGGVRRGGCVLAAPFPHLLLGYRHVCYAATRAGREGGDWGEGTPDACAGSGADYRGARGGGERKDEREAGAEAEDSGVYLHLDAGPDREQLPTPPPSPSLSRPSSFVPARCSTPPPPSPPSSCVAPTTASSPPLELDPTTSNLTRAPTARTYPLPTYPFPTSSRTGTRRTWPHRPSSPFPLPLTRGWAWA
jgi:hypothetical protein